MSDRLVPHRPFQEYEGGERYVTGESPAIGDRVRTWGREEKVVSFGFGGHSVWFASGTGQSIRRCELIEREMSVKEKVEAVVHLGVQLVETDDGVYHVDVVGFGPLVHESAVVPAELVRLAESFQPQPWELDHDVRPLFHRLKTKIRLALTEELERGELEERSLDSYLEAVGGGE